MSSTAFLASFGITKAFANLFVGIMSDKLGRKGCMILGWFLGIWLPVMQLVATNWDTIAASNLFLGVQNGLTWSCCIFMLLDISGPENRAFAIGLSETAGYMTSALFALVKAALIVDKKVTEGGYYRPDSQWLCLTLMVLGMMASFLLVETKPAATINPPTKMAPVVYIEWPSGRRDAVNSSVVVFSYASVLRGPLFAVAIAGLITNTLTGLDWGIVQQWYRDANGPDLSKDQVAQALLTYGISKGAIQWLAGFLSDRMGRRVQVVIGMLTQAAGLLILILGGLYGGQSSQLTFNLLLWGSFTLGMGTAILYPVLLACITDWAEPDWKATALGCYRFWRDLGFAIGGIIAAGIADAYGISVAFGVLICVCVMSALQFGFFYTDPREECITLPAEALKEVAALNDECIPLPAEAPKQVAKAASIPVPLTLLHSSRATHVTSGVSEH